MFKTFISLHLFILSSFHPQNYCIFAASTFQLRMVWDFGEKEVKTEVPVIMKRIILFLSVVLFCCPSFSQQCFRISNARQQECMGLDSMIRLCSDFEIGDDCVVIPVPIYLKSVIYTGYVRTSQPRFMEFYFSKILNVEDSKRTSEQYQKASAAFAKYALQEDTLSLDPSITTAYLQDTLFKYLFFQIDYDCTLKQVNSREQTKVLKTLFLKNGTLKPEYCKKWPQYVCRLYQYGYLTMVNWCGGNISVRLLDPTIMVMY